MTLVAFVTRFGADWSYDLYEINGDVDIEEVAVEMGYDGCAIKDALVRGDVEEVSTTRNLEHADYVFNAEGWK